MFGSHGFDLIVVSCSINVDGAAEPVPDDLNEEEEEEENEAEEFRSSWPTTITNSPTDEDDSAAVKQVQSPLHNINIFI